MYKMQRGNLNALYEAIVAKNDLFLPVKAAGKTNFALWAKETQVDLDTLKTVKSPKDLFFPQSEVLYTCGRQNGDWTVTPEAHRDSPFVAFGMKACDIRALDVLDRVFLTEPMDTYYAARRQQGILVSLACSRPEPSCFCGTFGIDCAEPEGDVVVWLSADALYWESKTEKGRLLTEQVQNLLEPCGEEEPEKLRAEIRSIRDRLPLRNLDLSRWGAQAAERNFDSPLWEELYKPCLACGTCTFVCPTCQCYDIKDFDTGHGVQRYRCWDSCMYSDFTMMAHGNNRTSQMQRFRQRFLHKLAYFPANNDGTFSCVGCGRCVDKCPSHLNIIKVIKAFEKEEA